MSILTHRLVGLGASLGLLLLVVAPPVVLVAIGAVPNPDGFSLARLTSPDDGTLAVTVIGVVAWLAWLVFTASVALELGARIRGFRAPRLPGLAVPQLTAGRLLGLASLLFVAAPTAAPLVPAPAAVAATSTPVPDTTGPDASRPAPANTATTERPASGSHGQPPTAATVPYTVRRGDSLWKIAEQHLGDGRRYTELVALNEAVLHGRPDFIAPGTVLRVPDGSGRLPSAAESYIVQPGDTLSAIAAAQLGDATAYPRIFEASRHIPQPDGDRLTDPDLLRPGWRLTIPGTTSPPTADEQSPSAPTEPAQPLPPADPTPSGAPQTPPPTTASRADTQGDEQGDEQVQESSNIATDGSLTPGWVLPGLSGAGAVLAGSLLIVLLQHRRTQQRYRRPGRIIASPPSELRAVEKTAHLTGTLTAPRIDVLNRALRHLAATAPTLPRVRAVNLAEESITVHLGTPVELPEPWHGEQALWSAPLESPFEGHAGDPAPYPLLVSFGQDRDGALTLVNLEELGSVSLTGDADSAVALGRHVAAELSLNPWSGLVEIETLGIGAELAGIDPLRLHQQQGSETGFLQRLAHDLDEETHDGGPEEPEHFRAVIATADADPGPLQAISKVVTQCAGRPGVAVVRIGGEAGEHDVEVHLSEAGRLTIEALDLDLAAAGLNSEEATACAAITDLTRDVEDEAVPLAAEADQEALTDQAGALRNEAVEPRPDEGPAGPSSMLPAPTNSYEHQAATTAEDVERLSPVVSASTAQRVTDADPGLDDDLTRWHDPDSPTPRLTLLGPVNTRTCGEATAVTRRKPFYVELVAYLALHPNGVTTPQVCDSFGLSPARARSDLAIVRRWLGTDPRTGEPHLPSARTRNTDQGQVGAVYQLHGVMSDLDLFRRLRTRGQSRGEEGIADLISALELVSGEPFTGLRPAGWSWLLDGDRLDHIMTCAIVDVAHILTSHALSVEEPDLARFAAETAYHAAPDDETSRLDLIQVAAATGHADLAKRQLTDDIFNRSDDGLAPVDLPERTARVLEQQRGLAGLARGTRR